MQTYQFLCFINSRIWGEDLVPVIILSPLTGAQAIVRSKAVLMLLIYYCSDRLFAGLLCMALVLLFITLCPSSFENILMWKRELVALH